MKQNFGATTRSLAIRYPDKVALINLERNRSYTFAELHVLTNRIANALRSDFAVGKGDRFLIILENDNIALLHFWTIFKQEGTAVFTNLRDSLEDHRWQAELAQPKVAFIELALLDTHAKMLADLECEVVVLDAMSEKQRQAHPDVREFWDVVNRASDAECEIALEQREHPVMMRFTSGTTGRGKCAIYAIDNWIAARESLFINRQFELDAAAVTLIMAPISHSGQAIYFPTLSVGGTCVTMNAFDLEIAREVIAEYGVTHTLMVPTVLYRLLELQREQPRNLTSLKTVIYGTAPMNPPKLAELLEEFGPIFLQVYGSTEAPIFSLVLDKSEHRVDSEKAIKRLASAGQVTPGVEFIIADEDGRPKPVGEIGEIRIRSRATISGYLADPNATANEFSDGAWQSGDLAYMDEDGFVYIVDRIKDMIISGGFNVYAVEVEAALSAHPDVMNSAVVGVPHAQWGESVHADVVLREGGAVTEAELIAHARALLGGYKTPKSICFVEELPLSAVGKVLRRVVRDKYWQGRERRV